MTDATDTSDELAFSMLHMPIVVHRRTGRTHEVSEKWCTREDAMFKAMLSARARGGGYLPAVVRDVSLDNNQAWNRLSLESILEPGCRPKKLPPAFIWLDN